MEPNAGDAGNPAECPTILTQGENSAYWRILAVFTIKFLTETVSELQE